MLAFVFAISIAPPAPPAPAPWRLVSTPDLHIGLRPALLSTSDSRERALGATLQVTCSWLP